MIRHRAFPPIRAALAVLMALMGHGVGMVRLECPTQMGGHVGVEPGAESPPPSDGHAGHHPDPTPADGHHDREPCSCPPGAVCVDLAALPSLDVAIGRPVEVSAAPPVDFTVTSVPHAARTPGSHPPSTAPPALL
jgi:hypothetical protein